MIPIPDAQAAYSRVTNTAALPGDTSLLTAAAQQGGMPAEIVNLGNAIAAAEAAYEAYLLAPTPAAAQAWAAADDAIRPFLNLSPGAVVA